MKKWMELFADFEESGYTPSDIKRIVMVYEMSREHDEMLKEMLKEKNSQNSIDEDPFFQPELVSLKNVN